ncbi:MAG: 50S ribosomal protein L5 [Deltaproteobacteria bacterium]|nr:MAG: 50S ribosomal protein L5 [Deltaproteobacteria bacterium]
MSSIKERYDSEIVPLLMKEFSYNNHMQVPKITKIVVNMGLGEAVQNPKVVDSAVEDLRTITGQQPIVRRARRSIAGFKLREGMRIGCCVTLRRERMYEFLERLISVALPRVRDFRGISKKAFDGKGNYSLGIREQSIFPEIDYDKIDKLRGLNVTIVTTAETDDEGRALLTHIGLPFRRN